HLKDPRVGFEESPTMLFDNNRKIAKAYYKNDLGVLKKGAYAYGSNLGIPNFKGTFKLSQPTPFTPLKSAIPTAM
ncbi:hypothetical protein, partial [Clostridioides difficile]|uniref:hypothetical protein n=1 Tax=Clostridioides difficile TaxID=1496 RepID=UPI0018F8CDC8